MDAFTSHRNLESKAPWCRFHIVTVLAVSAWNVHSGSATACATAALMEGGVGVSFTIGQYLPNGGSNTSIILHETLADGASTQEIPCRRAHPGYDGSLTVSCRGGNLSVDASSCLRTRCPFREQFVRHSAKNTSAAPPIAFVPAGSVGLDSGNVLWTEFVQMQDGRLVAAPAVASSVLEVTPNGEVRTFGDVGSTHLKYRSLTAVPGQSIAYAVPYFATSVLRIDVQHSVIEELEPVFPVGGNKWFAVAYAGDRAWGLPFDHSQVLRIQGSAVDTLGDFGDDASKWWEAVAVGTFVLGIPCAAASLLLIDAASDSIRTFGGPFGAGYGKWRGAMVVPGTSFVYALPFNHGQVLKVDVATETAELIGPDFGSVVEGKWTGAAFTSDRRILGIPGSAEAVLSVDTTTDEVLTLGQLPAGSGKWFGGALSVDGLVLGIPYNARSLLVVDPASDAIALVNVTGYSWRHITSALWHGAAVGATGAVYAAPASSNSVLRLGISESCLEKPTPVNATCDMGTACNITVFGAHVRAPINGVHVLQDGFCGEASAVPVAFDGWTIPQPTSIASQEVGGGVPWVKFALGVAVHGEPKLSGAYKVCWSDDPAAAPEGAEYSYDIGWITVRGPHAANSSCILGLQCNVSLVGRGLLLDDELAVLAPTPLESDTNRTLFSMPGLVNPARHPHRIVRSTSMEGDAVDFDLGVPLSPRPGHYAMRWARGRSGAWVVDVGTLAIVGPREVGATECNVGDACITVLSGLGLELADVLSLRPSMSGDCSGATQSPVFCLPGWCGASCVPASLSVDGFSARFALGAQLASAAPSVASLSTKRAFNFTLCWASGQASDDISRIEIALGTLQLLGPAAPVNVTCTLGLPCSARLHGYRLASENLLAVTSAGMGCRRLGASYSSTTGMELLADIGLSRNPVPAHNVDAHGDAVSVVFDLGPPHVGAPATYRLCWEASEHDVGLDAAVEVGSLTLVPNDCTLGMPELARSPPCAEGGFVPHRGTCTPRCAADSDPDEASLSCDTGVLSPPSFRCYRRCLSPPEVANAEPQTHCASVAHGDWCVVSCPAGSLKSGNYLCNDGVFVHQRDSTVRDNLAFHSGVCFRPCDLTAIVTLGADAAVLQACSPSGMMHHGESCYPTCPSGSVAFDLEAEFRVAELQCRDGSFDPPGIYCVPWCTVELGSIPGAKDLHKCAQIAHRESCELQCESNWRKSGDLRCELGQLNEARCRPPCDLQALWPAGIVNAMDLPCKYHTRYVVHGAFCEPDCVDGYSNVVEASFLVCNEGTMLRRGESFIGQTSRRFQCFHDCGLYSDSLVPHAQYNPHCSNLKHGTNCSLTCASDQSAAVTVTCTNGTFHADGVCQQACLSWPVVDGASSVSHCAGTKHSATCDITCRDSYVKVANPRCVHGDWDTASTCMQACSGGPSKAVACAEGSLILHGNRCTMLCPSGYATDQLATCDDGTFNVSEAPCKPIPTYICGPAELPGVAAQDVGKCDGTPHGGFCVVNCTSGFTLMGTLECSWGVWTPGICRDDRPKCAGFPTAANGVFPASCADTLVGHSCPVICNGGFQLGVKSASTCLEGGVWEQGVRCVRTACGRPPAPPNSNLECNGITAADYCDVKCNPGYGKGGVLECLSAESAGADSIGSGAWRWKMEPATPCRPLSCNFAPSVAGMSYHSCDEISHGSSCAAFQCQAGHFRLGEYRCEFGLYVTVPTCIFGTAGVRDVPAAVLSLKVNLVASWGDLASEADWGERASAHVLAVLQYLLVDSNKAVEVMLLGYSQDVFPSAESGGRRASGITIPEEASRRLGAGIQLTYVVAVLPPAVASTGSDAPHSDSDLQLAASVLAAELPSLLNSTALGNAVEHVYGSGLAEPLLGYGGEVLLQFAGFAAAPVVARVGRKVSRTSAPPPPSTVSTFPPTPVPTVITTAPKSSEAATDMIMQIIIAKSLEGVLVCIVALILMCLCCCIARRQQRRTAAAERAAEKVRHRHTIEIVQNTKKAKVELDPQLLSRMSVVTRDAVKERLKTSADSQRGAFGDALAANGQAEAEFEFQKRLEVRATQVALQQEERVQQKVDAFMSELEKEQLEDALKFKSKIPTADPLIQHFLEQGSPQDLGYFLQSQIDFEPVDDLPDDFVEVHENLDDATEYVAKQVSLSEDDEDSSQDSDERGGRESMLKRATDTTEDAKAQQDKRGTVLGAAKRSQKSLVKKRSTWAQQLQHRFSMATMQTDATDETDFSEDPASFAAKAERIRMEALGGEAVSMKEKGLAPGGFGERNKHALQFHGQTKCKLNRGTAMMRNFHYRSPELIAMSEQAAKELNPSAYEFGTEEERLQAQMKSLEEAQAKARARRESEAAARAAKASGEVAVAVDIDAPGHDSVHPRRSDHKHTTKASTMSAAAHAALAAAGMLDEEDQLESGRSGNAWSDVSYDDDV